MNRKPIDRKHLLLGYRYKVYLYNAGKTIEKPSPQNQPILTYKPSIHTVVIDDIASEDYTTLSSYSHASEHMYLCVAVFQAFFFKSRVSLSGDHNHS